MTPREAAEQRLAETMRFAYNDGKDWRQWIAACARIAAEAIYAALDEHHCGCCDSGGWDQIDPWDAVLPPKEAVK
jgi:hypothetical protein